MEYFRKQAKALVRAHRAGEPEAVARAEAVLGDRARQRFQLSDAQHVVARGAGKRTWSDLVHASAAGDDVEEALVTPGPGYGDGEDVVVRVRRRHHRYTLDDAGRAVEKAGRPAGWLDVTRQVVDAFWLNVNRRGVVFVPAVDGGVDREWLAQRVAECSAAVFQELLELGE